jgi:hypothetical protein
MENLALEFEHEIYGPFLPLPRYTTLFDKMLCCTAVMCSFFKLIEQTYLSGFFFREDWCMKRVNKLMGFAIGAKYVESAFDPQAKIDMKEMILNLKMAFSSLVEESDWMDEETKINALEKAAAMKEYIGYPDWITNRTTLELAYQGV